MARIENAKVRERSGGYERLFGNRDLGILISRVQSAVISSGTELERIILARVDRVSDLDEFLGRETMPDGVLVAPKAKIKRCRTLQFPDSEPDFLVFKRRENRQACHVVELKDGHVFDTKKAAAERRAIHSFIASNAPRMPYRVSCHFCCFNQDSREAIVSGFKRKITIEEAMTGREFCELLEIDYDRIVIERQREQPKNVRFFLEELVKIGSLRRELETILTRNNGES